VADLFDGGRGQQPAEPGGHRTVGELGQPGPVTADHDRGGALGPGGVGERLRDGAPGQVGVGAAQFGGQFPVASQVLGRGAGHAVADLDVHDQEPGVVGPGQFGGAVDDRLTPARARVARDDQR
jgi:hypothetical protein